MSDLTDTADALYGAVLDSEALRSVPDRISRLCGSDSAVLMARDGGRARVLAHNLPLGAGLDCGFDRFEVGLSLEPLGFDTPRLVGRPSGVTTSRVQTRAGEMHCLDALLGDAEPIGALALQRGAGAGPFPEDGVRALEGLLPHLSRALELRERLERADRRARMAESALDRLALGVGETDAAGRLLFLNLALEALLEAQDGLHLVEGRLDACDPEASRRLRQGYKAAATTSGALVRLARPSGRRPLALVIARNGADRLLVLVDDGERAEAPERLGRLFGLTEAEARLAAALCEGLCLKDIAKARGVKITTVRTQAQRVLDKAGVSRQAELVALAARAPALLPPRD